jgi:hypothetical protein
LTITAGSSLPAIYDMPSCINEIPGLEEEVIALIPAADAPKSILMDATSLSAWMNSPPNLGRCLERYSGISFCGVMGYPK